MDSTIMDRLPFPQVLRFAKAPGEEPSSSSSSRLDEVTLREVFVVSVLSSQLVEVLAKEARQDRSRVRQS